MIRKVFLQDNYLVGFTNNLDGTNEYDLPIEIMKDLKKNCYKLVDGQFVLDEEKYNAILEEETKQARIDELKRKLSETDYIYCSLAEQGRPEGYYDEVIAQRKLWRKEIQELEGE